MKKYFRDKIRENVKLETSDTSLRRFRAAMSRQRAGGTPCKIACYGSSTTYGLFQPDPLQTNNYPQRLRAMMASSGLFGNVYEGEVWISKYQSVAGGSTSFDTRYTLGAGWVQDGNGFGLGNYAITNNTTNNALTFNSGVACTGFTVTYVTNPSFSRLSWSVDGGAENEIDCSTSTGTATLTISSLPLAVHTLSIKLVINGTKRIVILNVKIEDSTRPAGGVLVTHCGINGSKTADWVLGAAVNSHPGACLPVAFTRTAPDLAIIQLGLNDANSNIDLSVFESNYTTIVQYAKARNCDVVLMMPHPFDEATLTSLGGFTKGKWVQYQRIIYKIAADNDCGMIDMSSRWPDFATGNQSPYLYYATGDSSHASNRGYFDITTAAFNFLKSNI